MHYMRGAFVLAFGQVTLMHCVRAVLALAVAIALPQMACAQTPNAIHMIISPVGATTPATPTQTCTEASCQKLVPRYPSSPTYMLGILEYNTVTCKENTPGMWAGFPSKTSNNGQISTGFASGPPPSCASSGTWTYAVMYFNWTAHNNRSTPSPSLQDGYPMDQFNGTWTDPNTDGFTMSCGCMGPYPFTFNPFVNVVRPIGETTDFVEWTSSHSGGTYAKWMMTLMPPNTDSGFDFNGENIQEQFGSGYNTCASRAPGVVPPESGTPSGTPANWTVGQIKDAGGVTTPAGKNVWGYDFTGFDACTIFAYQCAGVTLPQCGIQLKQGITIKSPADRNYTAPLYTNIIGEGIGGEIYSTPEPKFGFGPLTGKRFSSGTGDVQTLPGYVSKESDCLARPLVLSILRSRPRTCLGASTLP